MHKKAAGPFKPHSSPFSVYKNDAVLEDGDLAEAVLLGLGLLTAATRMTRSSRSFAASWMVFSPSAITPALKSIQPDFFWASGVLVEIFRVGAGAENGVPRPVENRIRCAPAAVMAVAETRSLPGPYSIFRPLVTTGSP